MFLLIVALLTVVYFYPTYPTKKSLHSQTNLLKSLKTGIYIKETTSPSTDPVYRYSREVEQTFSAQDEGGSLSYKESRSTYYHEESFLLSIQARIAQLYQAFKELLTWIARKLYLVD